MDWRVLHYAVIYFLIQMSVYGVVFYLPTEIAVLLGTSVGVKVGFVSAIPWVCALAATYWIPRAADRYQNHRLLAVVDAAGVRIRERDISSKWSNDRAGGLMHSCRRVYRSATAVLDISYASSHRERGCRWNCVYQCGGCAGRILRAQRESLGGFPISLQSSRIVSTGDLDFDYCGCGLLCDHASSARRISTLGCDYAICVSRPKSH